MKFLSAFFAAASTVSALSIDLKGNSAANPDSKTLEIKDVEYWTLPYNLRKHPQIVKNWNRSPHKFCATNEITGKI